MTQSFVFIKYNTWNQRAAMRARTRRRRSPPLAAGTGPAAATPTPTVASAFEPSNGEITGFDFSVENVVIPASINGVTVTKIGQSAFLYTGLDSGISTIVVPSTVTFVGDYAFGYNELLECDLFLTEKVRR